ncbi:monocarboxylate transporter 13 [Arapaima gigas]
MGRAPSRDPTAAPDGGWGWVVVGALFLVSALVFGLIRSLGIFFVEFMQYFGRSAQAVSWITSIGVAVQQLMSPLGTALCNAYGARPVVMVGGLLSGLGLILASQATSLTHLYLTMGFISGLGWALVFTPVVASVMQYFSQKRSLAMGLGFTGVGISSFVFSPLFQLLVEVYAWRGALLILGALSFNIMACGALIRPLRSPKTKTQTLTDKVDETSCSSVCSRAYTYLELSLLFQKPFIIYAVAITLFNAGYFVPHVYLVAHSQHVGFSEYQAAFTMSAAGVADLAGRVVAGLTSDLGRMRLPHILSVWTGFTSLFMLLLSPCSSGGSYTSLLLVSLAYGFCAGAMAPLIFSLVPEIVGMQRMLGALGLLQLIESVGGLLGTPLSGWLKDQTGSYLGSFLLAGGCLLLGTLVLAGLPNFFSCNPPASLKCPKQNQSPESELLNHTVSMPNVSSDIPMSGAKSLSVPYLKDHDVQPSPGLGLSLENTSV